MTPGTCIHFTGFGFGLDDSGCCAAGANYAREFGDDTPGLALRAPCIEYRIKPAHGRGTCIRPGDQVIRVEIDRRGHQVIPCGRRIEPTDEQVQQDRIRSEAWMQKAIAAITVASAWRVRPKPAEDRRETVACPVCQGRLHLSQSACNGHVHGACETRGCVRWME